MVCRRVPLWEISILTWISIRRFLLKYASRDEVELLSRGNGGIVEVRKAIAEYEETSPLYGFLKYRRRSVVIKYLPEGCSRLIQGGLRLSSAGQGIRGRSAC